MNRTTKGALLLLPPALALTVLAVEHWSPGTLSHVVRDVSPGCVFRRYTGLACPGCGGTRAARALLAGDVWGACRLNFFLIPSVFLLLVEYVRSVIAFFRHAPLSTGMFYIRMVQTYAWLTVAWFILRNVFGI